MERKLNRRQVIKTFVLGSAFSNIIGQTWSATLVHEIKPLSHIQLGVLKVNLDDFPALAQPLGSVRISTSPLNTRGEKQLGLFAPVIINRAQNGDLHIMSAECTHEGCTVRRLNPSSQRMVCPCHFSQFAVDGSVLAGPAGAPLLRYNFQQRGTIIEIELPEVFFEITSRRSTAPERVELSFIAFENITYEIHFRDTPDGPTRRVPFATTPAGPINQFEFIGNSDLPIFYLERPGTSGIFQIVMKTQPV